MTPPAAVPVAGWRRTLERLGARGSFARNLATVMTGTTVAQLLGVAVAPLLTRLYAPGALGAFGFYLGVVAVASVLVCGRYEQAVVLPESDEEGASLLVLSVALAVLTGLVCMGVALAAGRELIAAAGMGDRPRMALLLPVGITGTGVFAALNAWAQRRKNFRGMAGSRISQAGTTAVVQVGVGAVTPAPQAAGLVLGHVLGNFVGAGRLGWKLWREDGALVRRAASPERLRRQAVEHSDFPRYSAPMGMLNTVSQQIPNLLFPRLFGAAVLGHYFLSYRVFSLPLSVVGAAFTQVFYQKAAEHHAQGLPLHPLLVRSYRALLLVSVPPGVVLMLFAPPLFAWVFGPEWREAGEFTRLLVPWLALKFATSPATVLFPILGRQRLLFWYENVGFVLRVAALLAGAWALGSANWAVALFSAVGFVICAVYSIRLLSLAAESDRARGAAAA